MKNRKIWATMLAMGFGMSIALSNNVQQLDLYSESVGSVSCEYLENPQGIDVQAPRLSWKLSPGGSVGGNRGNLKRLGDRDKLFVAGHHDPAEALDSGGIKDSMDATIVNGTDWMDTDGNRIVAHEGEIARFGDTFYWYGSSYANNPKGRFRMDAGPVWNGMQVYRSTDLKNWTYKGVCLPRPESGFGKVGATGRGHVMYNEKTKKYVMWYRWFVAMPASFLCVATADHPEGPFTPHGPRQMGTSTGFGSDMNVFQDDDGKGYVIYCDHNKPNAGPGGQWRYAIRIDSLSDDYLTSNREGVLVFDRGCEAPAMVKHRGKYIAVASGVHGWAGSDTKCATADSPLGAWTKQADISEQRTWGSQVTDLIYLKESDTVMALCDQWWNPDRSDIEKSRFLFLPLHLDENTGKVKMEYREKWHPLRPQK